MDPQTYTHHQPEFELPPPTPKSEVEPNHSLKHGETQSIHAELPQAGAQPQTSLVPNPLVGQAPTIPAVPPQKGAMASAPSTPANADDIDLIEKEWVERAKVIVEHTKDDPHRQNKEINKFKAAYIKQRYNKELKLTDE